MPFKDYDNMYNDMKKMIQEALESGLEDVATYSKIACAMKDPVLKNLILSMVADEYGHCRTWAALYYMHQKMNECGCDYEKPEMPMYPEYRPPYEMMPPCPDYGPPHEVMPSYPEYKPPYEMMPPCPEYNPPYEVMPPYPEYKPPYEMMPPYPEYKPPSEMMPYNKESEEKITEEHSLEEEKE